MPELTVKIDQVALLREDRQRKYPDPVAAALLAELAGADRISIHLNRKRSRSHDRDARILRNTLQTELVLEMAPTTEMFGLALELTPARVILVEEHPKSPTIIRKGMDLFDLKTVVSEAVETLNKSGIAVCLCIDPDPDQIRLAHKANAGMVQFHAGAFGGAKTTLKRNRAYMKLVDAVNLARKLKLGVSLGHGLCQKSVKALRTLHAIDEFSIGHSIIANAVLVGMERAVREMIETIRG